MADTIDLHLSIQNSLEKTLKQTENTMKSFNSLLEKSSKNFEGIGKSSGQINDTLEKTEKTQKRIIKETGKWKNAMKDLAGTFLKVFSVATVVDTAKGMMQVDKAMKQLSFRMGEAGKSTEILKNAVYDTAQTTGIAADKAAELVGQLRRLRVPSKDIGEMATNTARFAEITGASAASAATLAGELMRTGRLGSEATTNTLAGIVKVQRAFGLTEQEIEGLNDGLIESTKMLHQMGKNASEIAHFNKGVVKLAGAFTSVGISAQEANKFVSELLDPGRVEENALLYARLGVSLEDAFTGNVDPGMLAGRFKELGQELKGMSGPAAAAMAKQLGMPLGQLRAMADMDLSEIEKTLAGGGDGAAELADAHGQQLSAQEQLEKSVNRMQTTLQSMMDDIFMPIINKVVPIIQKVIGRITGFLQGIVRKNPMKALLAIGGLIVIIKLIRRKFNQTADETETKFKSVATRIGESFRNAISGGIAMGAEKKSRALNKTVGGGGGLTEKTAALSATAEQNYNLIKNQLMLEAEQIELGQLKNLNEKRNLDFRINQLEEIERTGEQEWELNKLLKQRKGLQDTMTFSKDQELSYLQTELNLENELKWLGNDSLKRMNQQLQGEKDSINTKIQAAKSIANAGRVEVELAEKQMKWLKERDQLSPDLEKDLKKRIELAKKESNEQREIIETEKRRMNVIDMQQKKLADRAKKRGVDLNERTDNVSGIRKLGNFIGQKIRNAGRSFHRRVKEAGKNLKQRFKDFGERLKEFAKSLAPGKGGLKKVAGGVGMALGPIMMIARLFGRMEPIQEVIASVMEAIKPIFETLVKDLLVPLVKLLLPPLMKILGALVKVLGRVIWAIGKVVSVFSKDVGDKIVNAGNKMMEAGDKVFAAADNLAEEFREERRSREGMQLRREAYENIKVQMEEKGFTLDEKGMEEIRNNIDAQQILKDTIMQNNDILAEAHGIDVKMDAIGTAEDLRSTLQDVMKQTRKDYMKELSYDKDRSVLDFNMEEYYKKVLTKMQGEKVFQKAKEMAGDDFDISALFSNGAVASSKQIYQRLNEFSDWREKESARRTESELIEIQEDTIGWLEKLQKQLGELPEETGNSVGGALTNTVKTEWSPAMVKATREGSEAAAYEERGMLETVTSPENRTAEAAEKTVELSKQIAENTGVTAQEATNNANYSTVPSSLGSPMNRAQSSSGIA